MKIVVSFLLRRAANYRSRGKDLHAVPVLRSDLLGLRNSLARLVQKVGLIEEQVRIARSKQPAGIRTASIHHHRPLAAPRQRRPDDVAQVVIAAIVIERPLPGPDPSHDIPPFLASHIAVFVRVLASTEHIELILIPSAYDVESER